MSMDMGFVVCPGITKLWHSANQGALAREALGLDGASMGPRWGLDGAEAGPGRAGLAARALEAEASAHRMSTRSGY